MAGDFADYDPNMGQADRAKRRKDFPRGTGTGEPDIEEGGALAQAPAGNGWTTPGSALDTIVKNIDIPRPSPESVQGWLQPGSGLHSLVTGAPDAGTRPPAQAPRNVAQGTGQAAEQPAPAPARPAAPAAPATPSVGRYPTEGSNDLRGYPSGPTPANVVVGSASGLGPNGQPVTREYTRGDLAQKATYGVSGGGIGADGMTDAQRMNAPFHQAYTQMEAEKKAQNASQAQFFNDEAQRNQRLAAAPGYRDMEMAKSAARAAQFRATDGADMVLAGGNDAYQGQRLGILQAAGNAKDRLAQMEGQVQAANASPRRDLVAEQIAQQHGADTSAVTQLGAAQQQLMNPLAVQAQKQATSSAGTAQDIAKIALAEHQLRQGLLKEYAAPGITPERQAQIHDALLAQSNRDRPALFGHAAGGSHPDDPTRRLPDVIYDVRTGKPVAAPSAPAAAPPPNHVAALKAGKVTAAQFDQIYGKDASKQYMAK